MAGLAKLTLVSLIPCTMKINRGANPCTFQGFKMGFINMLEGRHELITQVAPPLSGEVADHSACQRVPKGYFADCP